MTRLLYESDYTSTRTSDVLLALRDDPRLRIVPRTEILETPIVKLAAAHGLVNSNGAYLAVNLSLQKGRIRLGADVPPPWLFFSP